MPVWGPILVFSELTAAFSSQTASRVILNHHQINYLCSLSPTFLPPPFCLSTTLSTNLMFYRQIISSCSSAEDTLGALEGREPVTGQDSPLKLQKVQGKHLLGGCYLNERPWASAGGEHPAERSLLQERRLICFLSQLLLAEGQWQGNASSQFPSDVIWKKVADQLFKTLSFFVVAFWRLSGKFSMQKSELAKSMVADTVQCHFQVWTRL